MQKSTGREFPNTKYIQFKNRQNFSVPLQVRKVVIPGRYADFKEAEGDFRGAICLSGPTTTHHFEDLQEGPTPFIMKLLS